MNEAQVSRRNDIELSVPEPFDPDKWEEYEFLFTAPRPLTAVDGGTVNFPMWATIKLPDGTWKKCDQTTISVRQVTSCEFSEPSSPEIDYSEDELVVGMEEYNEYAPQKDAVIEHLKTIGFVLFSEKFSKNPSDADYAFVNVLRTNIINNSLN